MWFIFKALLMLILSCNLYGDAFLAKEAKQATKEKKLILLTVSSDRCPYCIKMKKDVFESPNYKAKIVQKYVHLEVTHDEILLPAALHPKYLPTNYILSPKGFTVLDEFAGYIEPKHFLELLDEVYAQEVK